MASNLQYNSKNKETLTSDLPQAKFVAIYSGRLKALRLGVSHQNCFFGYLLHDDSGKCEEDSSFTVRDYNKIKASPMNRLLGQSLVSQNNANVTGRWVNVKEQREALNKVMDFAIKTLLPYGALSTLADSVTIDELKVMKVNFKKQSVMRDALVLDKQTNLVARTMLEDNKRSKKLPDNILSQIESRLLESETKLNEREEVFNKTLEIGGVTIRHLSVIDALLNLKDSPLDDSSVALSEITLQAKLQGESLFDSMLRQAKK